MHIKYRVGIDVGSYSLGLSAIEIDDEGMPINILSSLSLIHDSGVDPAQMKSAVTRLAASGVARRTRRLYRRKRKRLLALDKFIEKQGWVVKDFEEYDDPFYPWRVRKQLIETPISNPAELGELLSIALRHIARHRGWRNPYSKVNTLHTKVEDSSALKEIRHEASQRIGQPLPENTSLAQIVCAAFLGKTKLRGPEGLLSARLQQSDYANEILRIAERQGLDKDLTLQLIDKVFAAESPKGSAAGRVGKDPLQPTKLRAAKASRNFQKFRILGLIGNLRIREDNEIKRLSPDQVRMVFDHLYNLPVSKTPSWGGVAEILGIDRGNLLGTATMLDDGERAGSKPPVNETRRSIMGSSIKPLKQWWESSNLEEQDALIKAMSNAEVDDFDSPAGAKVQAFFADIDDDVHAKLDNLHLPMGRAAYSEDTLDRLSTRMLNEGLDLYEARTAEFNTPRDWAPPAPPIGEPVGNPAVDRVLKGAARWLSAAENEWGAPLSVNIEHVRAAFVSESTARSIDRDNQQRAKRNAALVQEMNDRLGIEGRVRRADIWRHQSIQRQNCQCAYCGTTIDFKSSEMDHIVPRRGPGSTNTRDNLVAVCKACNLEKSNIPFAVWAQKTSRPGVSVAEAVERTRHWIVDNGLNRKQFNNFVDAVRMRLSRTSFDEELDNRSIESVAWMANELRARIKQKYHENGTKVRVFKGAITAEARAASGINGQIKFIDGSTKTRLDRRHHAVDAAVIAFMTDYVAETLAVRSNLKFDQELRRLAPQWKEYRGKDTAHQNEWYRWVKRMKNLLTLLNTALDEDRIVVTSNVRLRLGNGAAHDDTIRALKTLKVGDAISAKDIDRASTEALWCALTRHPDYDLKEGLPADPKRSIRLRGEHLSPNDEVTFFPVKAGALALNGGYVELGDSFHHARVYKIPAGKKSAFCMMRVYTIDLLRYRNEDLFSVELPPQTMTVRQCEPKLRKALTEGTAEYLGWLVVDDELLVEASNIGNKDIAVIEQDLGTLVRWRVDGFESPTRLRLRPLILSKEGLKPELPKAFSTLVDTPGWRVSVNPLFTKGNVTVIRRDSLGRPRIKSNAHLPVCFTIR